MLLGFQHEAPSDDQLCPSFDKSALFLKNRAIAELRVSGKQRSDLVHCLLLHVGGRASFLEVRSVHALVMSNESPTLISVRSSHFLPRTFHVVLQGRLLEVGWRGQKLVLLRPLPVFVFLRLVVAVHLTFLQQLRVLCSDDSCKELVHAAFDLLVELAQECLNFWAHAQQEFLIIAVLLSPWHITQVCSRLLHQRLNELSLLTAEHVCRCLETSILVSGIHCEARL